ncbi:MAG: UDP-glucose/GDP-mannose dehydrogenase family protein [bacterium]|nr:UDP-glucose/GDP-mannose dehydrogenase family protein [bacterium]
MNIAIIGTGYVGLVTGTIFAELGNNVICVDINAAKIALLREGKSPIYEPGLAELITRNIAASRLHFTTEHLEAVREAQVIFNAVDTPSADDGSVDMSSMRAASTDVGRALASLPSEQQFFRVIVNKSTVPVGTANQVREIISTNYRGDFDVVSNPEFLREGQAVSDCLHPDRIVIGDGHPGSRAVMEELYRPFDAPILFTDVQTAEMIKYASNSFLAMSISFINNLSWLCEKVGADIEKVSEGMKLDRRIGKQAFLAAGPGYGGSCFPKDIRGIVSIAADHGVDLKVLRMVDVVNNEHRQLLVPRLEELMGSVAGKRVAIWGLAFKPETDDLRDAASTTVIPALQAKGAEIHAFDPVAQEKARELFKDVNYHPNPYEAITDADALMILTEWNEFISLDKVTMKKLMRAPVIFDTRNVYEPHEMAAEGFTYASIGRPRVDTGVNTSVNVPISATTDTATLTPQPVWSDAATPRF